DTFWFRRSGLCRLTTSNVKREQGLAPADTPDRVSYLSLWTRMLSVQPWQRRFIGQCDAALFSKDSDLSDVDDPDDPALPLYGESGSEGEFSDSLQREMADELKESAKRGAKAVGAEKKRVDMINQVVKEKVEQYARDWKSKALPQLERKARYLWGRYITRGDSLVASLADLRDRRLKSAERSVVNSGVRTRAQAIVLCEALRATVDDIARTYWLLGLIKRPRPLPASPSVQRSANPSKRAPHLADDQDGNSGGGSSSDGLSDFIDDTEDPDGRTDAKKLVSVMAPVEAGSHVPNDDDPLAAALVETSEDDEMQHAARVDGGSLLADSSVSESSRNRGGRRNIKAIRKENDAVLSLRQQHLQADKAIQLRLAEWEDAKRAAASEGGGALARARGYGQGSGSDGDDDDDGDDEVLVSSMSAASVVSPGHDAAVHGSGSPMESGFDIDSIGTPVLVNPGRLPDQQDVMIPGLVAGHLKDHQLDGIRFMWRNIVMLSDHSSGRSETTMRGPGKGGLSAQHGCVLAHSMGLGKTLQTITLIYTLLNEIHCGNTDYSDSIFRKRRVLILCPATVQSNWASEFWKWTGVDHSLSKRKQHLALDGPLLPPPFSIPTDRPMALTERRQLLLAVRAVRAHTKRVVKQVIQYSLMKNVTMRLEALRSWHSHGGVLIMAYTAFRELMQDIGAPKATAEPSSDVQEELRRLMVDEGPSLVIADEGHTIKNPKTKLATLVNKLKTKARICLTGYPLQNNLEEYWTMVDFCFPGYLGDLGEFRNSFVNPIKNGLYIDSTPADKRQCTVRLRALQQLLETLVDRRDSSVLHHQLPRRVEYIISCPLTPVQQQLYRQYVRWFRGADMEALDRQYDSQQAGSNERLFQHGMVLLTICNHPAVCQKLLAEHRRQQEVARQKSGSGSEATSAPVVIQDDAPELVESDIVDMQSAAGGADTSVTLPSPASVLGQQMANAEWCRDTFAGLSRLVPLDDGSGGNATQVEEVRLPEHSTKVLLVLDIIRQSVKLGERVLVFSRSLPTLDYLRRIVDYTGAAWADGRAHDNDSQCTLRIDGNTPVNNRQALIDKFNEPGSRHNVFFISSGTGSIGINLVAASRVILFDVGWNPLYDEQAVARAYRYGQTRRVYVYRLLTTGTWEDRLFNNNIFKVSMTRRVVDKQTMGRHISREEMKKYFQLPPQTTAPIPADRVAALVA
ncbi:hypothetical protein LPJ61_004417, partial [Coemansia biformis]